MVRIIGDIMPASTETLLQKMLDLEAYPPSAALLANAVNGLATVTLPADTAGRRWHIDLVTVSYSAAPTGGLLTVISGATPIFQVDITAAGPTTIAVFRDGNGGAALSIVLSAGGSGITGRINANAQLV